MPRRSNREIEQYYFRQFQAHFSLPSGEIEHDDKPDVVIRGDRAIGVEIANLYLADGADPGSEQVQRERREAVVREAQRRHLLGGGKNIELTMAFDATHPIMDMEAVASALAIIPESTPNQPTGALSRRAFEHIAELAFIYYNAKEYADARWRVSQLFTVPNLSVDRVADLVAAKEERLANYKPCDAYWLLLVVDFIDSAQDQDIMWPSDAGPLKSTYERVLIYKPQFAQWTEVPLSQ